MDQNMDTNFMETIFSLYNFDGDSLTVTPEDQNKNKQSLFLISLRGEKVSDETHRQQRLEECPSQKQLFQEYDKSTLDKLLHANRDSSSSNMIIVNEYDMDKEELIYTHFLILYIHTKVLNRYYYPITLLSILITINAIAIILFIVHREVIEPIQEMSQMTEFMLNPDKSQQ